MELKLKEGDTVNTNSILRAFSREPDATINYMINNIPTKEPVVIYRTNGHTLHYNITEHTGAFKYEKESWVETGKLKIDKITHHTGERDSIKEALIKEMELGNYPDTVEHFDWYDGDTIPVELYVVDVSPA